MDRAHGRFSKAGGASPGGSSGSGQSPGPSRAEKRAREYEGSGSPSEKRFAPARRNKKRYDLDYTKPHSHTSGHNTKDAQGQEIVKMKTNYFALSRVPTITFYQYHADFEPEIDNTRIKKAIFHSLAQKLNFAKFFTGSVLYTTRKLNDEHLIIDGLRKDGTPIQIRLRFSREICSEVQNESIFQVMNTVMRQVLQGLKLNLVGRNYFDALASREIRDLGVEVWPGYITSIRQHDETILMCCETSSKVMRNENLYSIYSNHARGRGDVETSFRKEVIGTTVLTGYNNKTYRIDDVDFEQTPASTFETKKGPKSYIDYYREKYNIHIRNPNQPLLLSRSKDKSRRGGEQEIVALIPELCRATGITEAMRSDFRYMRSLSSVTRLNPTDRVERLLQFSRRIQNEPAATECLNQLNLAIDRDLINLEGRIMKKPKIIFQNGDRDVRSEFSRTLREEGLHRAVRMSNWFVLSTRNDSSLARDFANAIRRCLNSFKIDQPQFGTFQQDAELVREIEKISREDPQLILIVAPNNHSDRYQAIKRKCCIDKCIPTQVVLAKTMTQKGRGGINMSVATKIAIQICCKIGGSPWGIKMPLTKLLTIGYDISHDTRNKNVTFGAMVASLDNFQTKYFSAVSKHDSEVQLSNDFTLNVIKAIREYQKVNNEMPNKIIIYRDGVGDGQIAHVIEHEKNPMEKELKKMLGDGVRFTFIIVNKKTNTRFFVPNNRGYDNPGPGTVVDTKITLPERYDFYLVPTDCRQGTVSPTYYNVIYDTICLPAAKLQMLTYFMSHNYYNWTDAITVPGVCKYAAKLAFLCSQHLHSAPHVWSQQRLYFL